MNIVNKQTKELLKTLENHLNSNVKGQREALRRTNKILQIAMTDLSDEKKPLGSLLFLGPTGVGKTETTKVISDYLFNNQEPLSFNMSQYQTKESLNNLIGDTTGYLGLLGDVLSVNTSGVLLFDEMEKAHPDILNLFLQILDEATIDCGASKRFDLSNYFVVMTSNIGSDAILHMNQAMNVSIERTVMDELKSAVRPEFLNRFDDIIVFNKLNYDQQREIAILHIDRELKRLRKKGYELTADEGAIEFLIRKGFHKYFGARPMKRTIHHYVCEALSYNIVYDLHTSGKVVMNLSQTGLMIEDSLNQGQSGDDSVHGSSGDSFDLNGDKLALSQ